MLRTNEPKTFTDIWEQAAKDPDDIRHELAKAILARRGTPVEELKTEHDAIDEVIKDIPPKLGGRTWPVNPDDQSGLTPAQKFEKLDKAREEVKTL